ncbi:hypothetical protein M405DRAFT_109219 [Rhizopogon salebrosus TDB-379]|nr:hypothetical protein M405DRAFT_109219 [Rhizopogon salebrosus TDB-379]
MFLRRTACSFLLNERVLRTFKLNGVFEALQLLESPYRQGHISAPTHVDLTLVMG